MKRLLLPLLIVFAVKAHPQNYQLLYSQQERLYSLITNGSAGLSITNIEYIDGDSIFYLNHNWQYDDSQEGGCYYPEGPSIFGSHVKINLDGSSTFYNADYESITILPQASSGESWLVWSNSESTLHVEATVNSIATESILEVEQNVKTIHFQALDASMETITSHPINAQVMKIGEITGLVRCPSIPNFPFSNTLNLTGIQDVAGIQNLTWREVYNYDVGDEIHTETGTSSEGNIILNQFVTIVLSRDDYPDSTVYSMEVSRFFYNGPSSGINPQLVSTEIQESVIKANPTFDPLAYTPLIQIHPEWGMTYGSYLYAGYDENVGRNTKWNYTGMDNIFHINLDVDTLCFAETIDWYCFSLNLEPDYTVYYEGLGGPYYTCNSGIAYSSWNALMYFSVQGETWGQPLSTSAFERLSANGLKLYPNPASSDVRIDLHDHMLPAIVQILDMHGRVLHSERIAVSDYLLSRQGIAAGLYHVRLIPANGQPLSAKLMWKH